MIDTRGNILLERLADLGTRWPVPTGSATTLRSAHQDRSAEPSEAIRAELREWVVFALGVFKFIQSVADLVPKTTQAGSAERLEAAEQVHSMFKDWLEPSDAALTMLASARADGYPVPVESSFREAILEARSATSVEPVDAFATMNRIRRQGVEGWVTTESLRDEFQRRVGVGASRSHPLA